MAFDLGSLLQQYIGGAAAPADQVENHFDQASQNAGGDLLSQGLAAAFRSDQTPAFGQMAGQLFGQSNPNQQAGMLNTILAGMGPAVLGSLLNKGGSGGGALGGLGGLLGQLTGGGAAPQLTPAQASALTPDQVQVIASHAEQANPGIIDQMSAFYAQHPTLVKTLGSAALTIALAKMAEAQRA
jgi:hypothetical protein